jgi:hypothetical protein
MAADEAKGHKSLSLLRKTSEKPARDNLSIRPFVDGGELRGNVSRISGDGLRLFVGVLGSLVDWGRLLFEQLEFGADLVEFQRVGDELMED